MTIRLKLTILSIAGILVANALISLAVFSYLQSVWLQEIQSRVQRNLRAARTMYECRGRCVASSLHAAALSSGSLAATAAAGGPEEPVQKLLQQVRDAGTMDFVTLLDRRGCVVARAESATAPSGDLSEIPLVAAALQTRLPASGTVRVSGAILQRISDSVAARAQLDVLPTPEAEPGAATSCTEGLVAATAVPLLDAQGAVQGLLYGGDLLNQRADLVDSIRDAIFQSPVADAPRRTR